MQPLVFFIPDLTTILLIIMACNKGLLEQEDLKNRASALKQLTTSYCYCKCP